MPLNVKIKKIYKQLFYIIYFKIKIYSKNMKDTKYISVSFMLTNLSEVFHSSTIVFISERSEFFSKKIILKIFESKLYTVSNAGLTEGKSKPRPLDVVVYLSFSNDSNFLSKDRLLLCCILKCVRYAFHSF